MRNKSSKLYTALLTGIIIVSICAKTNYAQQLDFDEIKVIAPYEPTISDAFKTLFNPSLDDTLQIDISFDYSINPLQIPTKFSMDPLSPARMRGEPLAKLYNGFVKAGLGNYTTPYGEIFYNSLRSNDFAYGVRLKHLSSGGKIDDYGHSGYSDNLINLHAKRFFRNHTFESDLSYERNMIHYYGFRRDDYLEDADMLEFIDQLSNKDIRQVFHYISPSLSFRSNYLDNARLQHDLNLRYHYLTDRFDAFEHHLGFQANLGKDFMEDPLGFADNQGFQLEAGADYYYNINSIDSLNTGIIKILPTLHAGFGDFNFYVGLNATAQLDTVSHARFYPVAGANINLISDVLQAYTTLSGGLEKQNLRHMSTRNPFINTNLPLGFTNTKLELRGGFKGSLSSFASYNFSIASSNIDNYPFFVTDNFTDLENKFLVVYDDIRLFNFRAELFGNVGERLSARFTTDYYQFSLENELEPWHEPTLRMGLSLRYNIQDKIILTGEAFGRNSVYARVFDEATGNPQRMEIQGFHVDTSLGIEYRYTKILSVFLNLNNVSNQPLQRWYNYPSHGFNLLGGVSYAF